MKRVLGYNSTFRCFLPQGQNPIRTSLGLIAASFVLWGILRSLDDVMVSLFQDAGTLSYAMAMRIHASFFSAYLGGSIPAGILLHRYGYRALMIVSVVLMLLGAIICLPALWFVSFPMFLGGIFGIALGIAVLQTTANPCISLFGAEETAASRLLLVQSFVPIGSVIAPLVGYLLFGSWEHTRLNSPLLFPKNTLLLIYAILAVLLLALALLIRSNFAVDDTFTPVMRRVPPWRRLFTKPMLFGIAAAFLFVGAEATVLGYSIPYLSIASAKGYLPAFAATMLSSYWMAVIAGRLAAARLLHTIDARTVLQIACFSATFLIIVAIYLGAPKGGFCLLALGLCNAAVFPCIFSLSVARLEKQMLPQASALLSTAICGGGVMPMVCGLIADHSGVRTALALPCCIYGFIGCCAFVCYPRTYSLTSTSNVK